LIDPKFKVSPTILCNYPIQGGAASVQMLALRKVYDALRSHPELDAFLVAAIHDEILLEAPDDYRAGEAGKLLEDAMRAALVELYPEAVAMQAADLAEAVVIQSWGEKS
jgi:DNA polymerase I-like protein with 3'-5' exonuclease and polymerase domains